MTGAITAAAVGAVAVGASAYEVSQTNSLQSTALGMAQTTQGEQQYYNSLLQQLIANPSSVSSLPGYQFQLSQGSAAVADQMAASGFAGSGNEAAALTEFGQGLASSFYGQQAQLLASLSGVTSASSPASDVSSGAQSSSAASSSLTSLLQNLGIEGNVLSKLSLGSPPAGTPAAQQGLANPDLSFI